jgi:RHS repeat-associated protein
VRELTDSTGAIRARYDYNPYGYRTKISGDLDASFGYTSHYLHQASGLNLALYRAYDSMTGRWISRDRFENAEMDQGPNLYSYGGNDPLNKADLLGLFSQAELDAGRQIAISGLLLRRQQLVAVQNGDFQRWQQLEKSADIQGSVTGPRHRNAPLDQWEASQASRANGLANALELELTIFDKAIGWSDQTDIYLSRTESEILRQLMFLLWVDEQTPDDEQDRCAK